MAHPLEELTAKLVAHHVVSFENEGQWAGYSPSNGLYWVAGKNFETPEAAAYEMSLYMGDWVEVDQRIDEEVSP